LHSKVYNKFRVIEDIIPSVVKKGYYAMDVKHKKLINKYKKLLEEKTLKILSLENNQANKHINNDGKYIYIVKSQLNKPLKIDEIDSLKIGKTKKYKIRIANYNTATKDNTIVLYRAKVNDISAVENCIKGLLSKKVYRSKKEYYNISLTEGIKIIRKCIKLTGSKMISEDKFYKKLLISRSKPLNGFEIQINNNNNNQIGGDNDIYNKYKYNYYIFKN
jgi:hypothetical protein